jgi:hypothetical protein
MIGSIRSCLVALSLGLGTIATPAAAGTITYSWLGTVDYIAPGHHPGVTLQQKIGLSLTLNDAVSDADPSSEIGSYNTTIWSPEVLVLAVNIDGRTDRGMYHSATVLNDHNGADAFSISGESPHTGIAFSLDFSTSDLAVLTSDALPLSLIADDFSIARFAVYQHGGPPLFGGTLLTTTPLPGSVVMLVSALTGLVGAGWWKSSRRPETIAL